MSTSIMIAETREMVELKYIDTKSGCDCLPDIANIGTWTRAKDFNGDSLEYYIMPQEDYDWWIEWIEKAEEADEAEANLREDYGSRDDFAQSYEDAVYNGLNGVEFNDIPAARLEAIEGIRARYETADDN